MFLFTILCTVILKDLNSHIRMWPNCCGMFLENGDSLFGTEDSGKGERATLFAESAVFVICEAFV